MEVYVDDMMVKSWASENHIIDLRETFATLRKYRMKLNLAKYTFGVTLGKFLGFMVSCQGIEANPEKVKAVQEISPLKSVKEVQHLVEKVATLNRFISRSAEYYLPFFKILKQPKDFEWAEES